MADLSSQFTDTELAQLFQSWWLDSFPTPPGTHAKITHLGWARQLLLLAEDKQGNAVSEEQPATVRIRVAVVVGPDGSWFACGSRGVNDAIVAEYTANAVRHQPKQLFWIEADLDVRSAIQVDSVQHSTEPMDEG